MSMSPLLVRNEIPWFQPSRPEAVTSPLEVERSTPPCTSSSRMVSLEVDPFRLAWRWRAVMPALLVDTATAPSRFSSSTLSLEVLKLSVPPKPPAAMLSLDVLKSPASLRGTFTVKAQVGPRPTCQLKALSGKMAFTATPPFTASISQRTGRSAVSEMSAVTATSSLSQPSTRMELLRVETERVPPDFRGRLFCSVRVPAVAETAQRQRAGRTSAGKRRERIRAPRMDALDTLPESRG